MLVSILHRVTGDGMAVVGLVLFTWWLAALAAGKESYHWFLSWFTGPHWNILGYVIGIGLTFSLFQHMMSGIRHFVLDTGAGYELKTNKVGAILTVLASIALTALFWFALFSATILGAK